MRYTALSSLMLTFLGALLMLTAADPTPADGQEKKDPALKAPFDQFVTMEGKGKDGKAFKIEQLPAFRNSPTAPSWRVPSGKVTPVAFLPYTDVTITDKGGKVYKIKEVKAGPGPYLSCRIDEPTPKD